MPKDTALGTEDLAKMRMSLHLKSLLSSEREAETKGNRKPGN